MTYFCAATGSSCQQLTAYIAAVADDALTASSEWPHPGRSHGPASSRLFARRTGSSTAGWVAGAATTSEYIQVRTCASTIDEAISKTT